MHTSTHITIHTNNNIIEIKITRTISIRHTLTQFIIFLFFLISNKEVYSENYLLKTEAGQTIQREKQTEKKNKKASRKQQRTKYKGENKGTKGGNH